MGGSISRLIHSSQHSEFNLWSSCDCLMLQLVLACCFSSLVRKLPGKVRIQKSPLSASHLDLWLNYSPDNSAPTPTSSSSCHGFLALVARLLSRASAASSSSGTSRPHYVHNETTITTCVIVENKYRPVCNLPLT